MSELIIIQLSLTLMVPLLLASIGEIINEKAGVINIGIEGIFLLSALTSVIITYYTNNPWFGLITGFGIGALIGFIHGIISTFLRGDQIISGIGINLFAYGIGVTTLFAIWESYGNSPSITKIEKINIYGYVFSPLIFISIALAVIMYFVLFKTMIGMKITACGENAKSAELMGIKVLRLRLLTTMLGASLAGLGGAYLAVDWVGQYTKDISAGKGFIALAIVAFSKWNPLLAIVGSLIFGFFETLSIYLSITYGALAHPYLFKIIPYLATIVVISLIGSKKLRIPEELGKPYIKE
jgi:simple sugar transport system permease protein